MKHEIKVLNDEKDQIKRNARAMTEKLEVKVDLPTQLDLEKEILINENTTLKKQNQESEKQRQELIQQNNELKLKTIEGINHEVLRLQKDNVSYHQK